MAPIHVKPPYATDEPDSSYESAPINQRRVRQAPQGNPNDRSSAYDVYNGYLGDNAASRQSGVGALGLGLLNMDDDDDDDDDDKPKPKAAAAIAIQQPNPTTTAAQPTAASTSKHAALAAATAAAKSSNTQHIIAPKPGYPSPIDTLNNLARPEAAVSFQTRTPLVLPINNASQTNLRNPFADPNPSPISREQRQHGSPTSPSPSMVSSSPHPLQPPMTPITPVFARPAKAAIKFSDAAIASDGSKPIIRGDSEQTLLPNRGEKGDDFWRRFSMVAKEENKKSGSQKTSLWLKETQNGTMRLSRWVWIVGLILLAVIGGAIGIGWYVSHKAPDHQQPKAFGGSANEAATGLTSSTASVGLAGSTIRHVSATHTINRRSVVATSIPVPRSRHSQQRRLYSH